MSIRPVKRIIQAQPAIEGAGVHLRRAFGFGETSDFDPFEGIAAEPRYLDVTVPPGVRRRLTVETSRHAFAYVFEGSGNFRDASPAAPVLTEEVGSSAPARLEQAENRSLVLFDSGAEVTVQAGDSGIRFLLVSGQPLKEPVAWRGPIVMNTQEELRQAYAELRDQTFIKR